MSRGDFICVQFGGDRGYGSPTQSLTPDPLADPFVHGRRPTQAHPAHTFDRKCFAGAKGDRPRADRLTRGSGGAPTGGNR